MTLHEGAHRAVSRLPAYASVALAVEKLAGCAGVALLVKRCNIKNFISYQSYVKRID